MLFLIFAAHASSTCPWAGKEAPIVSATMTTVSVNGVSYAVRTEDEQKSFENLLKSCGADSAVAPLGEWRKNRRNLNIAVGVGAPALLCGLFLPGILFFQLLLTGAALGDLAIAAPIYAVRAHEQRELTVRAIKESTPPKK